MSIVKSSMIILVALLFSIGQACACAADQILTSHELGSANMAVHGAHMAHQDPAHARTQTAGHGSTLCSDDAHLCGTLEGTHKTVLSQTDADVWTVKEQTPQPRMPAAIQATNRQASLTARSFAGLRWLDPPGVIDTPVSLKIRLLN